jgi:hypothetical protein
MSEYDFKKYNAGNLCSKEFLPELLVGEYESIHLPHIF